MAETIVDLARFEGTCYRAAGWTEAGRTSGHRRAGRNHYHPGAGLKTLWLKPLRPDVTPPSCCEAR